MNNDNSWMSFSDLMTGLMVIFMFIAVSYMLEVQENQRYRDKIVTDFQDTKSAIHTNLHASFQNKFKEWDMEIGHDLSIRFTNPNVMFELGQSNITNHFKDILDEFLPLYFDILLQEDYRTKITEVRIEGHTDDVPLVMNGYDEYMGNLLLSQQRAANVLNYFRRMDYFTHLNHRDKMQIQYWATANGLSYGRALDDNKQEAFISNKTINPQYSRRVEFRIITTSEQLIEDIIIEMNK